MVPKRVPFWDQFWHQFLLKIIVFGKVPRAIWHYYSNVFRLLKGSALELAAEPLQDPIWMPCWLHFGSNIPLKLSRGRPRWILNRPRRAGKANRHGSKNGTKNGSMKNRLDVGNDTASDPRAPRSEAMGRD